MYVFFATTFVVK